MPKILDQFGKPMSVSRDAQRSRYAERFHNRLRARYDAAQTTDENERHWANADYLSPGSAMSYDVRRKTRARARYECQENNSYAKGMVLTLANDLIGTGPRLQLMTEDKDANRRVERAFGRWAREIRLAEKLRTMRVAKAIDGEVFAMLTTNDALSHDVKLDVKPFEADYVQAPWDSRYDAETDGVSHDQFGNPLAFYVLDNHPGSSYHGGWSGEWVAHRRVLHWFRSDRPGQYRGVTEMVTSLQLFAMLRRFTLATLAAAETAADFAAVLRTNSTATTDAAELGEDEWFDAIPIEYRALLTLPNGWDISQLKAEHPTTTYQMFKRELLNEIARCLNMPFNVAAADSSSYNYASGRMDHQTYYRSISVDQSQLECCILDLILQAWLDEAVFIADLLPESAGPISTWNWQWFWDSPGHVDPQKEATAQKTRVVETGTSHRAREYAMAGLDIDAEDAEAAKSYGVDVETYRAALFKKHFSSQGDGNADQEAAEEDETETAAA